MRHTHRPDRPITHTPPRPSDLQMKTGNGLASMYSECANNPLHSESQQQETSSSFPRLGSSKTRMKKLSRVFIYLTELGTSPQIFVPFVTPCRPAASQVSVAIIYNCPDKTSSSIQSSTNPSRIPNKCMVIIKRYKQDNHFLTFQILRTYQNVT